MNIRLPCAGAAAAALLATTMLSPGVCNGAERGTSFVDDFSRVSSERWRISDDWTNGAYQACTWSRHNIALNGGIELTINDRKSKDRAHSCAEVQSTQFYGYGTYEVRMRSVAAPGTVTAFFTYTGPPFGKDILQDEIDFEFLGKHPHAVQLNYYASGKGGHEYLAPVDGNASAAVNDYAFEWLPDSIRWFINGKVVHEVKRTAGAPFPERRGKIIISLWAGAGLDDWLQPFNYSGTPLTALYERVAFTAAGEPCQFPTSIVCREHPAKAP